jgi:hypothetical protein
MGSLADKPATSNQTNVNNPMLTGALGPALGYVTGGGNMMGSLLGINGGPAQTGALTNFANSGGMQFLRDQGNQQINSNMAAKGLLNSGATGKALEKYGQGLGSTYLNQYMSNLKDYAGIGLGAGGILADSGVEKHEKGAKKGILSSLVDAGSAAAQAYASGGASAAAA